VRAAAQRGGLGGATPGRPRPIETGKKVAALWYQAWGVEVRGSVTREPAMLKPTESVVLTDLDCQRGSPDARPAKAE
jgi:hypothetical protein